MGGPTIKKWKSGRVHEPWTLPSSGPPPLSIIFFPITRHANLYNINLLKISLYFDFFLLQHLFFFWKKKEAASLVYLYFPFTMNTAIINEKKNKSNFFSPCFTSPPPPPATRHPYQQPPCDLCFSFTSFLYQHSLLLSLHHKSYRSVIDPIYSIISHLFLVFFFFSIECGFILLYNRRTLLGCFWFDT